MMTIPTVRLAMQRALAIVLGASLTTTALAEPAQLPLLSRDAVTGKPNVMFSLDDSGSMEWPFMPDSNWTSMPSGADSYRMSFDPAEANGWPWTKNRFIATTQDHFTARFRSSDYSGVYYNPAFNYQPWFNSDGSPMPDAPPGAAPVDPIQTWRGSTNLIGTRSVYTRWCRSNGCNWQTLSYTPATYFVHNGGSFFSSGNFTRVRIQDSASFVRPASRTDCPVVSGQRVCSQAQEYQNFANWFTYYRKRIFIAIAAATRAFAAQGEGMRVGYGRINKGWSTVDNVSTPTIQRGVRTFAGNDRDDFFTWLRQQYASGGTPLRYAMDNVGKYFERTDNRGPWGEYPGLDDDTEHLACRKSYHILMTDGYWNGSAASTSAARQNVDNQTGPVISGPGGQSYQYTPERPFLDYDSDNLADIAMYYWNRDLRPDLDNLVTPDSGSPAFWQNLVQFTVGFGVDGTLDVDTALPQIEAGTLNWPWTNGNNATSIDDLWHAAVNSRGEYLSAKNPDEFADSLSSILQSIAERQVAEGGAAVTSATLDTNTKKFIPSYKSGRWSGEVFAKRLDSSGLPIADLWRASEQVPEPDDRKIYVGRGGNATPVPFRWASLDSGLRAQMGPLASEAVVEYLRGVRDGEGTTFRARDAESVLGDFVNSTPVLIGGLLNEQYQFLPHGTPGRDTYRQFLDSKKSRPETLFVGGNDGMLHAFSAETGVEKLAFIPNSVLDKVAQLSLPAYEHKFFVDGPMVEADAYLGGWRNMLVGSLGAGGRAVFALDVTNTSSLGASSVKWEFTHPQLGYTFSPPAVGVTRGGQWVAVFGNGVEADNNRGRLFVVNLNTGALMKQIGVPGTNNGLGGVRLVKDANNMIVAAYAGDTRGRVWRFDMSAPSPGAWSRGFGGQPLFNTAYEGSSQPILGTPEYVVHPKGGQMVIFGTGQLHEDAHLQDNSLQTLYGIWDTVPGDQNSLSTDRVVNADPILEQTFTQVIGSGANEYYVSSNTPIDFDVYRGWKLDMTILAGQRMLYQPQLVRGFVLFNTLSPTSNSDDRCSASGATGINVLLNAINGGQSPNPLIDTNNDGEINESDLNVSGYRTQADGSDTIMLGRGGKIVIQRAFGQTVAQILGRSLERTWRQILTIPR